MRTDATLLRLYADTRDGDAFAELVRRHIDAVYSAALRRVGGDTHLAEDVAQQVFVALERKAASLVHHPVLSSWLYVATRHEASNIVRTERRRKAREREALAMQDAESKNASAVDWSQVAPLLDGVIDQLDATSRMAVLLRFIESRKFAEIGTALDLTEDAARMRVERAVERMRGALARRGIMSSSTALGVALTSHLVVAAPAPLAAHVVAAVASTLAGSGLVATLAGVFKFMSTTKVIVGAASLAALGTALWVTTNEIHSSRAANIALSMATQQHAAIAAKLRDAGDRLRTREEEIVQLTQSLDRARKNKAAISARNAGDTTGANAAPPDDPRAAGDAFMARHPEVKRAVNDYARARVDFRFAELYRRLNLSARQIEQFRALVSAGFGMGASGFNGEAMQLVSGERTGRSLREDFVARQAQLETVLGVDGMKMYLEYAIWIEPALDIAAQAAGALWFTEAPLTPLQADQLVGIMNESRAVPAPGQRQPRPLNRFERFDWDAVIAKAANVLSAPQLAALEGARAHEQFNAAIDRPARATTARNNGMSSAATR